MKQKIASNKKANRNGVKKKSKNNFGKVGGLSHHIKTLKELVIFPLLHGHVYTHFNIKAPRGVLFYGPPGTGKTLVAGALANELNNENKGKINFFHRKGADVLDKWVGESEKKLRDLFHTASKAVPSIIFFDEIDALAPVRSHRNDHVHSSVVSTLLALMDGLDETSGLVVLGATNRLDAIDPALRRPGRFDKELYFPMPSTQARREILEVHTGSWKHRPDADFLDFLAENTAGFSGADLQALCAEAVISCAKRMYPGLDKCPTDPKITIDLEKIKLQECDFAAAKLNMVPACDKMGARMRRLGAVVAPLLRAQMEKIVTHIETVWPHFLQKDYRYVAGSERRYAGRLVLIGSNRQGLSTHLVPGLLQVLEHLPNHVLDVSSVFQCDLLCLRKEVPSVLVLLRVDEWWSHIEESSRISIAGALEDIHAGLPILTIATCRKRLPKELHDFFFDNCSVTLAIDDPTEKERREFFWPLFFDDKQLSFLKVLKSVKNLDAFKNRIQSKEVMKNRSEKNNFPNKTIMTTRLRGGGLWSRKGQGGEMIKIKQEEMDCDVTDYSKEDIRKDISIDCSNAVNDCVQSCVCDRLIKKEPDDASNSKTTLENKFRNSNDPEKKSIFKFWDRISTKTSSKMPLTHLEILYDAIVLCLSMNKNNFNALLEDIEDTLSRIEKVHCI